MRYNVNNVKAAARLLRKGWVLMGVNKGGPVDIVLRPPKGMVQQAASKAVSDANKQVQN